MLCALLGMLLRPLRAHGTPLGRLLLLPSRGIPAGFLCPLSVCSVAQSAALRRADMSSVTGRRSRVRDSSMTVSTVPRLQGWAWVIMCLALPNQIWAAPEGLHEEVLGMNRFVQSLPEPLDPEPSPPLTSAPSCVTGTEARSPSPVGQVQAGACSLSSGEELRLNVLQHAQNYFLQRPVEDTADIPVPPLPRVSAMPPEPCFEGVCYALAPGYQAEVLRLSLRPPLDLATFNHAVRSALLHLRLRYCFVIAPTVPQLGTDFASIVLVPKWLPQAGRQVVVFDFRALDGPVYAGFTFERVSHQECVQEAVLHGFRQCSIYVQGHSHELQAGDTFLGCLRLCHTVSPCRTICVMALYVSHPL